MHPVLEWILCVVIPMLGMLIICLFFGTLPQQYAYLKSKINDFRMRKTFGYNLQNMALQEIKTKAQEKAKKTIDAIVETAPACAVDGIRTFALQTDMETSIYEEYTEIIKKWCKNNGFTYRIQANGTLHNKCDVRIDFYW